MTSLSINKMNIKNMIELNKVKNWVIKGLFATMSVMVVSGCSSFTGVVGSVGESLVSAGDGLQSALGSVEAVQVSENTFDLIERYNEPVMGFDSWAMRVKAKEVCHEGYIYQSRHAFKEGAFAKSHASCVEGESCRYALEWRIQCKKVPYEPFSLFGKT